MMQADGEGTPGMKVRQVRGTIFLSHASADKTVVERVYTRLDRSNTFYDIRTIAPGQPSIEAMREGISSCSVFVLFHSPQSGTAWVGFEKELAEVQAITSPATQVLVCPIGGATHKTLPSWMAGYMTATADFLPSDVVRTIQHLHEKSLMLAHPEEIRTYPGREALQREISLAVMRSSAVFGRPLSALVLTGVQGMGRGTLAAQVIKDAYRGMRPAGPVFDLPDAGDAVDWHLRFYEDLNEGVTNGQIQAQIKAFDMLGADQQAEFLIASLKHWGCLNQVVTIRNRWGLRDKGHALRPWLTKLIRLLTSEPSVKLVLISERKLPTEEVERLGNVRQFAVEELDQGTIEYILSDRIHARYRDPQKLAAVAERIHGHPATANYAAYLVNGGRSMESLAVVSEPIAAFQDRILAGIFDSDVLSGTQKRILRLLSWFPRLTISVLVETFPEVGNDELLDAVWELVDFSLLDQAELGRYKAPAVVSSTYRRRASDADEELLTRVSRILSRQFESGDLDFDLIESLLVAVVAAGEELSAKLLGTLTPSRILPVVEKEYYEGLAALGEQARVHYQRCYAISKLAMSMKASDDSLENILFFGADASVRMGVSPDEMMALMRRKGFVTADYIEASFLYHAKRDFEQAARILSRSLLASGFKLRNVRLLTRIQLRIGQYQNALGTLGKLPQARLARDTGLVIMKVKALRGTRSHTEAASLLATLGGRDDVYGDIAMDRATVAMRAGSWHEAVRHIEAAAQAPRVNRAVLQLLKCACEVESGDNSSLPDTCSLARAINRDSDAFQLQARAALRGGDWRDAETCIGQIERKDWFDLNVELRVLDAKLVDPETRRDPVALQLTQQRREEVLRQSITSSGGDRSA